MSTQTVSVRPEYSPSTVNWLTATVMVIFHILAVVAFFFFTWTNLFVGLLLHWMAVGLGISLGYHRLHPIAGSRRPILRVLLAVAARSRSKGPISGGEHRFHHQHSDPTATRTHPRDGGSGARRLDLFGDTITTTRADVEYAPPLAAASFLSLFEFVHYVPR